MSLLISINDQCECADNKKQRGYLSIQKKFEFFSKALPSLVDNLLKLVFSVNVFGGEADSKKFLKAGQTRLIMRRTTHGNGN